MRNFLDIINGQLSSYEEPASKQNMLQRYVGLIEEGYTDATVGGLKVDEFIRGYVECMLWSSTGDNDEPLNEKYTSDDIDPVTMGRIEADCRSFLHAAAPFITIDNFKGANLSSLESRAGHDFWLTRVGHGSGFWDGDWKSDANQGLEGPLTKIAKGYRHLDAMVGDDGKIYLM